MSKYKVFFENPHREKPKLSIILLDWSVRGSFHTLDYLSRQNVRREDYEVIWVEFFGRRAEEIDKRIKESDKPPVDVWIALGFPETLYFHRHILQNVGIAVAKGEIICLTDSDAIMKSNFVETVINAFEENKNIEMHMEQARSWDHKFYPFNYPTVEDIVSTEGNMVLDGKPLGFFGNVDPIHTHNYGACLCARRDDLVAIGGIDEHFDYLGYVNGFYEATIRLANIGRQLMWHPTEYLYHLWHPGEAGAGNFVGPNDGRMLSLTALDIRRTGRTLPLTENPAVRKLRLEPDFQASTEALVELSVSEVIEEEWNIENVDKNFTPQPAIGPPTKSYYLKHLPMYTKLILPLIQIFAGQLWDYREYFKTLSPGRIIKLIKTFWSLTMSHGGYVVYKSRKCLKELESRNIKEVALYKTGAASRIFEIMTAESPGLRIASRHQSIDTVKDYTGTILVACNVDFGDNVTVKELRDAGISPDQIMLLL